MVVRCGATNAAGKSNGSSPGWVISAGSSCAMSAMRSTTSASSTWVVSSSCSVRRYEGDLDSLPPAWENGSWPPSLRRGNSEMVQTPAQPLRQHHVALLLARPWVPRLLATLGIVVMIVGLSVPFAARDVIVHGDP